MTEYQKAFNLLERASILDVEGFLLHNWELSEPKLWDKYESDDEILALSYTDDEGYIFEFSFNKKNFENCKVDDNSITIEDSTDQMVDIRCFDLNKLTIKE